MAPPSLFVSDRENEGERNIYTMNTDGANVQRLTPLGSNDREPKMEINADVGPAGNCGARV